MGHCNSKWCKDDLYEITKQSKFQDAVEKSIMEYRFMIGKHINNFNMKTLFQTKRVKYYDGRKEDYSASYWREFDILIDLRGEFIYGVYRS